MYFYFLINEVAFSNVKLMEQRKIEIYNHENSNSDNNNSNNREIYFSSTSLQEKMDWLEALTDATHDGFKLIHQPESNIIFKSGFHGGLVRTKILSLSLKTQLEFKDKFNLSPAEIHDRLEMMKPFFYSNIKKVVKNKDGKSVERVDCCVGGQFLRSVRISLEVDSQVH